MPGLKSCVAKAVKDDRKVEGVLEMRVKVSPDGKFAKVNSEGLLAGPMMWCIDEALQKGPGSVARENTERLYFRLRVLAAGGKGEVRLHPNVGPFINKADGKVVAGALGQLSACVQKSDAKERRKTGRARTEMVINTDGSVLDAHLAGKKLDGAMLHCMKMRLQKTSGFGKRAEPEYVEFALDLSPKGVTRAPNQSK